jgi:hypothetical protein
VPYLVDVEPEEIRPPVSQFQAVRADQQGTFSLVSSLAAVTDSGRRTSEQLARSFELLWPALLSHLNQARATPEPSPLERDALDLEQLTKLVQQSADRELAIPSEDLEDLGALFNEPDTGVVKLYGRPDALEKVGIRGGGAYFDFVRRDQQYGYGSDVGLREGQLQTGFAGANYGLFLRLGRLQDLPRLFNASEDIPPAELAKPLHEAWRQLWQYQPPSEMKEIRAHQREARGRVLAGVPVSEKAAVERGGCYLLRSIQIDRHDILVALSVRKILADRSCLLLWKILQHYDTPVAVGRDN